MKIRSIFIHFLFCCTLPSALSANTLHGRVINSSNHKAIDYATVSLLQPTDSSIVSSTICDQDGAFSLPLHTMQTGGLLRASAVGYRTGFAYCSFSDSTIIIELTEAAQMLGEITINAKRIQRTSTGYTVNLRGDKLTEGKQTNTILGLLPGITIQDNEISAYNLPIETIYVNGNKISNKEELAAIAAEELATVQVDLMPTGRDSGNNGGIIYINMRKPSRNGCYGNVLIGAGAKPFYGFSNGRFSSVINAKVGKCSIYNYLYSGDNNVYYDTKETRDYLISGNSIQSEIKDRNRTYNIQDRLSLAYELHPQHTIGANLAFGYNKQRPNTTTKYTNNMNSQTGSLIDGCLQSTEWQATLQYDAKLNDRGASLSITGDYLRHANNDDNRYHLYDDNQIETELSGDNSDRISDLWEANVQFVYPFSQKIVLNAGASYKAIRTTYRLNQTSSNKDWIANLVENSQMNGYVPQANVSASGMLGFWRYSVGITAQFHHMEYNAADRSAMSSLNQWGILPSVSLMYPFNLKQGHALMLMYRRMMDDIPYAAISPYKTYSDELNYTTGNPDLKAPINDFVMAGVSLFNNKLNVNAVFLNSHNQIVFATLPDNNNPAVTCTMPVNVQGSTGGGIEIETNLNPTRQWAFKLMGRALAAKENGTIDGVIYNATHMRYYATMSNNFTFSPSFGASLNGNIEPTYTSYDRTYKTVFQIDASLYKYFANRSFRLTFDLVAYRLERSLDTSTPEINIRWSNTTQSALSCNLKLAWFFNAGKKDIDIRTTENIQNYKEIKDVK